ncbi:MAG: hypothetical protein WC370_09075 [Dehalococcoidales bacterium]|jgi:hypothetical protein
MKTGKWLVLILILALLAVYAIMGSDYLNQRRQKTSLTGQITAAKQELALIPLPPADLAQQLAAAQQDLQNAESSFNTDTNDTAILTTTLRRAEESGVKAIPLDAAAWVMEKIAGRDYAVLRFQLEATGTFSQLLSFLDQLETGAPDTLVLEYLGVESIPGADATTPLTATVRLAVYALPPPAE